MAGILKNDDLGEFEIAPDEQPSLFPLENADERPNSPWLADEARGFNDHMFRPRWWPGKDSSDP